MQCAANVGLEARGFWGAAAAYTGFGLPAFLFMLVLAVLYRSGQEVPLVVSLLAGLRAVVVALVADAALSFGLSTVRKWWALPLVGGAAVAFLFKVSPIFVILATAGIGVVWPLRRESIPAEPAAPSASFPRWPLLVLVGGSTLALGVLFVFDRSLFQLALTMLRIDLFAFGGGFASIPLMQHEFVEVRHWVSAQAFVDGVALGQITPGPIVITATFVGYMFRGLAGAFVATLAIFLPSFVILALAQPYFARIRRNRLLTRAISGILLSFVGLLLAVTVRLGLSVSWEIWSVALAGAAFLALRRKVDILWVVVGGAAVSLVVGLW